MFIHWGTYALAARHEWVKHREEIPDDVYQKYFDHFDPDLYDPREWARKAREAGMKYVVITTKHHEGFCLWDSKYTDYKATNTPYGRDLIRPFVEAYRAEGLRIGFYYSLIDWHHPDFPIDGIHPMRNRPDALKMNETRDVRKYAEYMRNQVRELLTNYGPIGILWFDGGGSFRGAPRAKLIHADEILALIRRLQPDCIVNNRLGAKADYGTPEQHIPGGKQNRAFEVCMTLNRHWGYNKNDHAWKQPPEVIHKLVDIVSKGGNFLLNVGPTAEGIIPEPSVMRLHEIGQWLRKNGEAIYASTASPFNRYSLLEELRYTAVANTRCFWIEKEKNSNNEP